MLSACVGLKKYFVYKYKRPVRNDEGENEVSKKKETTSESDLLLFGKPTKKKYGSKQLGNN